MPKIEGDGPIGNNLFGSIGAMMDPKAKEKSKTSQEIDDFLYELPDNGAPTLELGDGLLNSLGNEGQDLFDGVPTKKEEEDTVLQDIIDEYGIRDMKDEMDETGQVPESIYFFYGGDSDQFVEALKFIGIQGQNREFATFLMSDEGRRLMTQNKLSIHVETGDIFYDNHNTEENFYNFLLSQQNDEAAEVPKKFSYSNSFENTSPNSCKISAWTTKKNSTCSTLKILNTFFTCSTVLSGCTVIPDTNSCIRD